jgi:hypothetical protein
MTGVEQHSEYEGGGVMPNTVFPKGTDALTPSDKLRLQSITGQEEDSRAPADPWFWQGGVYPGPEKATRAQRADAAERTARAQELRRAEKERYKETPY